MSRVPLYLLAALIVAGLVLAFAKHASTPDLTGRWNSWRSSLEIAAADGRLRIDIANPNGFLGGRYVGVATNDVVAISGPLSPLCSEIRYVRDTDKLEFCGEEFERVRR